MANTETGIRRRRGRPPLSKDGKGSWPIQVRWSIDETDQYYTRAQHEHTTAPELIRRDALRGQSLAQIEADVRFVMGYVQAELAMQARAQEHFAHAADIFWLKAKALGLPTDWPEVH